MIEFSKEDRKAIKSILKKGILRRHHQWIDGINDFTHRPYAEDENAFDRSMTITKMSKDFFREAMEMEEFYRSSENLMGIVSLMNRGFLFTFDLNSLSPEARQTIIATYNTLCK
ncbi:MAG: hypothetical protein LUD17_01580 [Bacteroidales bacterium]|nr:hypothetical protein [Bacteroidales bacterium]